MSLKRISAIAALVLATSQALATAYILPSDNQSLIGAVQHTSVAKNETIAKIGQRYDIGFVAIKNANPQADVDKELTFGNNDENGQLKPNKLINENKNSVFNNFVMLVCLQF